MSELNKKLFSLIEIAFERQRRMKSLVDFSDNLSVRADSTCWD